MVPHLHGDKLGGTTGEQDRTRNSGFQHGEINLWGVVAVGEIPSLTEEFIGEAHRVLECTQTHPPSNQHHKEPICLWVVRELTENQPRAKQVASFSLEPLLHINHHNISKCVSLPW